MEFYEARTTYPGADKYTARFFTTEEAAEKWIEKQDNGECFPTYDKNVNNIPFECCSWDDIKYWNGMI